MSTLVAQTISNGTVSTSSANVIQGSAKAWVNFNGTTSPGTIRAQYNVSSVTKNGTGRYTVNFTNAFADANYSVLTTGDNVDCATGYSESNAVPPTTTSVLVYQFLSDTNVYTDATQFSVAVFR